MHSHEHGSFIVLMLTNATGHLTLSYDCFSVTDMLGLRAQMKGSGCCAERHPDTAGHNTGLAAGYTWKVHSMQLVTDAI